ncbi:hypothetical protein FHS25_003952 [Rhizobium laguerreae]|uniref:Uncharacterized protein n=1 Tax=Rhizobium laguerreae TaxID=1076926 RepID=A0AAX2QTB1_9HYPH|nr:hypothetical protein [Rhizobium laguerreae]TCU30116.1 hypothetical protein EV131_101603 [Rhizobium laguerreae]
MALSAGRLPNKFSEKGHQIAPAIHHTDDLDRINLNFAPHCDKVPSQGCSLRLLLVKYTHPHFHVNAEPIGWLKGQNGFRSEDLR